MSSLNRNKRQNGNKKSFKGFQQEQWTWEFPIYQPNMTTIYMEQIDDDRTNISGYQLHSSSGKLA